ncbi:leucine-rich repeat-containing protein 31 isoform X5 [Hirundo rustica]|uniref:leucine-rich repeat-containing protein 31 isoform X5 n=1 Tax=Hirundo rustica TaxID=43150 RepID=UPI001A943704|nr:leucine-rich repeat-containing protein 31 isoform X5 [Hirundo rustica]
MEKTDDQNCQDTHEEENPKRSPFDFVIKPFQGKKCAPEERKEQPSAIKQFFKGFDFGKSEVKDRREIEETEIKNAGDDEQSEKQDFSVEDGLSHLTSEAESPSGEQRFNQFMEKLGKKPNSKNLDLNNCALSAADITELASLLPFLPELEEISLSWNGCVGGTLKALTVHLHHVNLLKVLRLNNCRLTAEDVISLDTALQHLAELRKLDISCNREIGGGFKASTAHLASLKNLEILDLHQCCVTEEDMTVLSQVIPLLSSLQELNLSSNKNVGLSSDPLLGRLRFLPKLRSVTISNCGLGEESLSSLAEAALHLPELEILDLSWNKCVGGNLKLLLGALKLATEIQVLRLSSCNLVAEDLALLTSLRQNGHLARLQKLDLSYNNNISDEGWAVFCQGLGAFKELSELDVSLRPSSCRDCGPWFGELLAALTQLPALAELGMQRWALSESQRKQVEGFNQDNKRNIRFDC